MAHPVERRVGVFGHLSLKQLSAFCLDLGNMLAAGLPLRQALMTAARRRPNSTMGRLATRLRQSIEAGSTFHQAMDAQGPAFPRMMRGVVRAAELAGGLDSALLRLGQYFRMRREQRNRFLVRLIYPCALTFVALCTVAIVRAMGVVLANRMGGADGGSSPLQVAMASVAKSLGAVGGLIVLYLLLTRVLSETAPVQEVLMRVPILGSLRRSLATANFSWAMEMMTRSGTPVREALLESFGATGNGAFIGRARKALFAVESGGGITDALAATGLFGEDYLQVIQVAEESGRLDDAFGRLAQEYNERTEVAARSWATGLSLLIYLGVMLFAAYIIISFWVSYYGRILGGG